MFSYCSLPTTCICIRSNNLPTHLEEKGKEHRSSRRRSQEIWGRLLDNRIIISTTMFQKFLTNVEDLCAWVQSWCPAKFRIYEYLKFVPLTRFFLTSSKQSPSLWIRCDEGRKPNTIYIIHVSTMDLGKVQLLKSCTCSLSSWQCDMGYTTELWWLLWFWSIQLNS